jgi:hypothetical protein
VTRRSTTGFCAVIKPVAGGVLDRFRIGNDESDEPSAAHERKRTTPHRTGFPRSEREDRSPLPPGTLLYLQLIFKSKKSIKSENQS